MIYVNEELKRIGSRLSWIDLFIPELYCATTIKDFVDNRHLIKPTRKLIPLGVFSYRCGVVLLPTVNCEPLNDKTCKLSDLETSIEVFWSEWTISKRESEFLSNRVRLYGSMVYYNPEKDRTQLVRFDEHGPEDVEKSDEKRSIFDVFRRIPDLIPNRA